jgi:hypothetical protein
MIPHVKLTTAMISREALRIAVGNRKIFPVCKNSVMGMLPKMKPIVAKITPKIEKNKSGL